MKLRLLLSLTLAAPLLFVGCDASPLARLAHSQAPMAVPKRITIRVAGDCGEASFRPMDVFVSNQSYRIEGHRLLLDFDRDGVPNLHDQNSTLGLSYRSADTNQDGYSDLFVYLSGAPLTTQQSFPACDSPRLDSDSDGLTDCEERLLGTDPFRFDTDGDGIPDGLELRVGLNPLDAADANLDPDNDGLINLEEIKRNTPPWEENDAEMQKLEIHYEVATHEKDGALCLDYEFSNVPLADLSNGNQIHFDFTERDLTTNAARLLTGQIVVPEDQPDGSTLDLQFPSLVSQEKGQ